MNTLECRIPQQLEHAVNRFLGPGSGDLNVLDLGCGTGLCGLWLRRHARHLAGIDLAPRMITKARESKVYDELMVQDVVQSLNEYKTDLDLIVAGDLFVYVGDMDPVFRACREALKPAGLFVFSVESHEANEMYLLRKTGRYAHPPAYIRKLADMSGMTEISQDAVILRKHKGESVAGHIYVYRMAQAEQGQGER